MDKEAEVRWRLKSNRYKYDEKPQEKTRKKKLLWVSNSPAGEKISVDARTRS